MAVLLALLLLVPAPASASTTQDGGNGEQQQVSGPAPEPGGAPLTRGDQRQIEQIYQNNVQSGVSPEQARAGRKNLENVAQTVEPRNRDAFFKMYRGEQGYESGRNAGEVKELAQQVQRSQSPDPNGNSPPGTGSVDMKASIVGALIPSLLQAGGASAIGVPGAMSNVSGNTGGLLGDQGPGGKIAGTPPEHSQAPPRVASWEDHISPKAADSIYSRDKTDPTANYIYGYHKAQAGDYASAYAPLRFAVENGNDDPKALTFAALSAFHTGKMDKANEWAAAARDKDPDGPMAANANAIAKLSANRLSAEPPSKPERAAPPPLRGTDSIPELDRPAPHRTDAALPPEAAALVADVNRSVAQAQRAFRSGETKEALAAARSALAKDPEDVRAIQVEAAALMKEGRFQEAKEAATKGEDLAPGFVPLMLIRTAAAIRMKEWREAESGARAVLAKEANNGTARRFLAFAQAGLGDRAGALDSLRQAAATDPVAASLLRAARSLPPGSDLVDLFMGDMPAQPSEATPPPEAPARKGPAKWLIVIAASLGAGLVAGLVILVLGRAARDEGSPGEPPSAEAPRPRWPGRS